jgi:hypothetical protein
MVEPRVQKPNISVAALPNQDPKYPSSWPHGNHLAKVVLPERYGTLEATCDALVSLDASLPQKLSVNGGDGSLELPEALPRKRSAFEMLGAEPTPIHSCKCTPVSHPLAHSGRLETTPVSSAQGELKLSPLPQVSRLNSRLVSSVEKSDVRVSDENALSVLEGGLDSARRLGSISILDLLSSASLNLDGATTTNNNKSTVSAEYFTLLDTRAMSNSGNDLYRLDSRVLGGWNHSRTSLDLSASAKATLMEFTLPQTCLEQSCTEFQPVSLDCETDRGSPGGECDYDSFFGSPMSVGPPGNDSQVDTLSSLTPLELDTLLVSNKTQSTNDFARVDDGQSMVGLSHVLWDLSNIALECDNYPVVVEMSPMAPPGGDLLPKLNSLSVGSESVNGRISSIVLGSGSPVVDSDRGTTELECVAGPSGDVAEDLEATSSLCVVDHLDDSTTTTNKTTSETNGFGRFGSDEKPVITTVPSTSFKKLSYLDDFMITSVKDDQDINMALLDLVEALTTGAAKARLKMDCPGNGDSASRQTLCDFDRHGCFDHGHPSLGSDSLRQGTPLSTMSFVQVCEEQENISRSSSVLVEI